MTFRLYIRTENAAFADGNEAAEVARILREAADQIDNRGIPLATSSRSLHDINGNRVGFYETDA